MGFPYSSGDVLTAADLNASSGLVLIKSQTISGTPTSVTITDAFSSTFANYRIMGIGLNQTVGGVDLTMELGTGGVHTSAYYGTISRYQYNVAASDTNYNNTAPFAITYTTTAVGASALCVDIFQPHLAQYTTWAGHAASLRGMRVNGFYNASTSFTDVTFICSSGTWAAGTIKVYGYSNG